MTLQLIYDIARRKAESEPDKTDAASVKATVKRLMQSTVDLARTIENMPAPTPGPEERPLLQLQA